MAWKKAPQELVDFLSNILNDVECQKRMMFGYPAYFIKGNMFIAAHQDNLILRVSKEAKEGLKKQFCGVGDFEPMPGRVMKEYLVIPEDVYRNKDVFTKLLEMSLEYVSSMPPKVKKKRKKR
jgi:TfoX/Sxy family transcriptional regulator of competence genes